VELSGNETISGLTAFIPQSDIQVIYICIYIHIYIYMYIYIYIYLYR
jgi:hypothetical protein